MVQIKEKKINKYTSTKVPCRFISCHHRTTSGKTRKRPRGREQAVKEAACRKQPAQRFHVFWRLIRWSCSLSHASEEWPSSFLVWAPKKRTSGIQVRNSVNWPSMKGKKCGCLLACALTDLAVFAALCTRSLVAPLICAFQKRGLKYSEKVKEKLTGTIPFMPLQNLWSPYFTFFLFNLWSVSLCHRWLNWTTCWCKSVSQDLYLHNRVL
jgi:hypothetical protein